MVEMMNADASAVPKMTAVAGWAKTPPHSASKAFFPRPNSEPSLDDPAELLIHR